MERNYDEVISDMLIQLVSIESPGAIYKKAKGICFDAVTNE